MQNEHINFNIAKVSLPAHQIDGVSTIPCSLLIYCLCCSYNINEVTPPSYYTYVNLFSQCSIGSPCRSVLFRLVSPLLHTVDLDTSFFVASVLTERLLPLSAKKYDTRTNTQCQ